MFCPNCGAEAPNGSQFCGQCGTALSPIPQPVQSIPSNTQQPIFEQQPNVQQPIFGQQAAIPMPEYGQPVAMPKKSKKVPIIIASCAAAFVAAILIVLFVVILPNTGIKGKLRHKWIYSDNDLIETAFDFKKNTASLSELSIPISWNVKGEDILEITFTFLGYSDVQEFNFSLSDDGTILTLTTSDSKSPDVYIRAD